MASHGKYFPEVSRTAIAIRDLRIQGATNVAKKSLTVLGFFIQRENPSREELSRHVHLLSIQRPTEPLLQNSLSLVLASGDPGRECARLIAEFSEDEKKMRKAGVSLIPDGGAVLTHCHSASVVGILKEAREAGKKFSVLHTETRPRYQGHKTARELVSARIRAKMFVDSAVNYFMPDADIVLLGADSLEPDGFINKIGSSLVALSAREQKKPLYVICNLLKFNRNRHRIAIERRPPEELGFSLPGLAIENPAFDFVPRKFVKGVVCEKGIFPFQRAVALARKRLR
jgi:ribose 1,5-bisphosphate isomerase